MTSPKPDLHPAGPPAPVMEDVLQTLQSEMEALLHLLPGAALLLSPRAQPGVEAVEDGFDNMPV